MKLSLLLGALRDIETDGAAALPVLRITGATPEAELRVGDGEPFSLSPGAYLFQAHLRATSGALAPRLVAKLSGGGAVDQALVEVAPGTWRCVLQLSQAADALALALSGETLIVGEITLETDEVEAEPTPTLRAGAVLLGRAAFRALPSGLRRSLLSGRRAKWLAQVRASSSRETPRSSGRVLSADHGADASAARADFENRLAVARGLTHGAHTTEVPTQPPQGKAKLIAFHLPQFHPIPENDAWWGKGFTEWANVAKAAPQFVGHYQPRLPGELGFYDLRTPDALKAQAALARAYGISAFCFHYYWFAGKRLLEAPLDAFAADSSIDMQYCLCWANENWTRRWDGDEKQVLIAQRHSDEDSARVFDDLARYMDDPRYLRVDGKPLLVVYRPDIIPDAAAMTALWRRKAAERGWPGVYLVATNAFRFDTPEKLGFDALVEFPPHGFVADSIAGKLKWLNDRHGGAVYDYEAVAAEEARRADQASGKRIVFPGVMPGWDNEARRPGAGAIYHNATPAAYGAWLAASIKRAERMLPADRRFVFINAWNEWAEGAHLEPDRMFGRAFLHETARVLASN